MEELGKIINDHSDGEEQSATFIHQRIDIALIDGIRQLRCDLHLQHFDESYCNVARPILEYLFL